MLSDFLILEDYYEQSSAALFFEDVSRRYGIEPVKKAFEKGELHFKRVVCGPDRGRFLIFLSQDGRKKARHITAH